MPDRGRGRARRPRRPTSTARFGSSRRESHDASAFYDRFVAPEVSADTMVQQASRVDHIHAHDARDMSMVETSSVALVVTSPPYFTGKAYEQSLGENGVPGDYFGYLELLSGVFAECKRVLEPGGRIAVNVANLGRRPYRSLAGDVTAILQDLGLLLRGEVVWWKGRAAGGSCAWGTFQRPTNPVLRDVTERIVIAGKGRFDRALTPRQRHDMGLPSTATISRDEFLEATTDVWEIPPESASRVGHPAPFPVELPRRLIELFTYEGDLVLDPFMGVGTTAVAAMRTARHFVGFDTDPAYVERALERVDVERARPRARFRVQLPGATPAHAEDDADDFRSVAMREGHQAKTVARSLLEACGFDDVRAGVKRAVPGMEIDLMATDRTGAEWAFDVSGAFTATASGLKRTETVWKVLGKAAVLHQHATDVALVLLTTELPARGSAGHRALDTMVGPGRPVFDVVELLDDAGYERLRSYASGGRPATPP